jgi:hypothetical protein
MIPKKKTEDEKRSAFEIMLKNHEYIYELSSGQAKDYLDLANAEYKSIIKKSPEFEAVDLLKKASKKSETAKAIVYGYLNNLSSEASIKILKKSRSKFIFRMTNGKYFNDLQSLIQYCEKYDYPLDVESGLVSWNVEGIITNLEEVIDLLAARVKIPFSQGIKRKPLRKRAETLLDVCLGSMQYESAIKWFINEGLCDPVTLFWRDRKKGYKSILINYIEELTLRGYIRELVDKEIVAIAKNTFNVYISMESAKRPIVLHCEHIPYFQA